MKTKSAQARPNAESPRALGRAESEHNLSLRVPPRPPRLCVRTLRLLYYSAPIILTLSLSAATNDLTSALQRGLFEEEANRNLEAAAQAYRDLSAQFDKDRKVAATAVFRLGEIYRKQGKTNEAVVQYERIVREFSDQETLATLSRKNLASFGRSFQPTATAALSPAARLEQRRLLEAEIKLLEDKIKSEKLLLKAGRADLVSTIATQRDLLALKRQLTALSPDATPATVREEQSRLIDEEIGLVEQKLERVKATAADREEPSVVSDTERELLALKRQRIALANEPLATTTEAGATLVTDDEEKEIRRIQAMIQNSPDLINAPSGELNMTPLDLAASKGQLRVAEFLLSNGADVNLRSGGGTPLQGAANNGHKAMVELLLERGADVNARDGAGGTALHLAAQKGFLSVAEVLIKHKADLNARNGSSKGEKTVLHVAVQNGNAAVIGLLLANGAELNVKDSGGYTPLHFAATLGQDAVVEQLLKAGADVDAFDNSKQTPLFLACAGNRPSSVKLLLTAKAAPNLVDDKGRTPLSYSVSPRASFSGFGTIDLNPGRRELVKTLLEAKADPNAGSADSPLLLAVRSGDLELTELLLREGADPNQSTECVGLTKIRNPDGSFRRSYERRNRTVRLSPLQAGVLEEYPAMVKLLLQFKADPKARNPDGEPLILGTLNNPEMLKAFLDAGADPNVKNQHGYSLLHLAASSGQKEIAELLLSHKADVNARDVVGNTPLYLAVDSSSKPIVELLLAKGADPNIANNGGQTPLDRTKSGRTLSEIQIKEIAPLLRQHGALDDLPDFKTLRVTRRSTGVRKPAFVQGTNSINRFTLLEAIARVPWGSTSRPNPEASQAVVPFPDFSQVTITRREPKTGKLIELPVDVAALVVSGDCSKNFLLEWGDLIDIPDREHRLNEQWRGLPTDFGKLVAKCLRRKITVEVKGEPQIITLEPIVLDEYHQQALSSGNLISSIVLPFRLNDVLTGSARLFSTSDLTRVKVRRVDSATGQTQEWVFDELTIDPQNDLWLRDGDVIEVPDKP